MNHPIYNFSILPSRLGSSPQAKSPKPGDKVVLGMSGGVDSSVSAYLLKKQGFQVFGLFMKNWEETNPDGSCTAKEDFEDVVRVCNQLDIDYSSIEFIEEYRNKVFSRFIEEYKRGYTPNPDVLCNREIKFSHFYDKAFEYGADWIATGHYCQNWVDKDGQHFLVKGLDPGKDQTYFLSAIDGERLKRVLFPVGHLHKKEVREIAKELGLATQEKKDSTGICFIGERHFREFLSQYLQSKKGPFKTLNGEVVGFHQGSAFYTLGQRKGLGLGGQGEPWFVVAKDVSSNTVFVERGDNHPALYRKALIATELSWISGVAPSFPRQLKAKARYRQSDQECTVHTLPDGKLRVEFDQMQRALTPGQYVVFYDQGVCLGGGVIDQVEESPVRQDVQDLNLVKSPFSQSETQP